MLANTGETKSLLAAQSMRLDVSVILNWCCRLEFSWKPLVCSLVGNLKKASVNLNIFKPESQFSDFSPPYDFLSKWYFGLLMLL